MGGSLAKDTGMKDRAFRARMRLDHLLIGSAAPGKLAEFYGDVMGMSVAPMDGGQFLCSAPGRRILIGPGAPNGLGFAGFACEAADDLAALRGNVESHGVGIEPSPSPLFADGAFAVHDPDGNTMVFGLKGGGADSGGGGMPGRLQHLVMRSRDGEGGAAFYRDVLGFAVADRVEDDAGVLRACFLRAGPEHHSFAVFLADEAGLDHHAYEVKDWNDIRDWADRVASREVEIMWGPGRHGPGNNLFVMFRDPEGNWLEISAELEIYEPDQGYRVWPHTERTLNLWGPGILRS